MNLIFINLITIAGSLYVWNWIVAYNHTKDGFSKAPFITVYWLFKPEILDDIGNRKRKNAIYTIGITCLLLILWTSIV